MTGIQSSLKRELFFIALSKKRLYFSTVMCYYAIAIKNYSTEDNKMKKIFAVLMVVCMVAALGAYAFADQTFIMGIDPEYPPFSYLGDDGEYAGFDVEVCKAACEKLGWDFEVFGVNWDDKLIQLDAGECDCVWSGMTILDSMKEAGYVISEPYFYNTQVLLVKEDSGIKSAADLAGKYVAVQLGTSGEALLAEDLADLAATFDQLVTCDSFLKCFTELAGGAVDAVFVDLPVAASYAAKNEGFLIINEDLGAEQYGIAFRSGDQALCDAIDGAVKELVEDGTYAEIAAYYAGDIDAENLIFLSDAE